jgi:hypothetical protein
MTGEAERQYVSVEQLTERELPEDDVEVPGLGWVRVRGLSRAEFLGLREGIDAKKGNPVVVAERRMIVAGMVIPKVTEAQVGKWMKKSGAVELDEVSNRISELSGIDLKAAKEAYRQQAEDPEENFPVLPS